MTRRKSVCSKWTLALLVVILCPYVHTRPQDASSETSVKSDNVETTTNPLRYRFRNNRLSSDSHKLSLVTNVTNISINNVLLDNNSTKSPNLELSNNNDDIKSLNTSTNRRSRVIRKKIIKKHQNRNDITRTTKTTSSPIHNEISPVTPKTKKAEIRKVITKWTDNTNIEDLDFSYEATTSDENENDLSFLNDSTEDYSTESTNDVSTADPKKNYHLSADQLLKKLKKKIHRHKRPKPDYPEESDKVYHVTASYPSYPTTRPMYVFSTPTPTPIITNVGNPIPWPAPSNIQATYQYRPNTHRRPTTQRPIVVTKPIKNHYNYHHSVNNYPQYPGQEFEVTTFQPTNAYADRIVIRPEEYAASPDECPTIFLTLNNTFQGQGKEACPDLNIAVNTNVVNKNVVVESEENEDGLFGDPFGIPFGGDSADESGQTDHHGYDSGENQEQAESASIEGQALTNYNAGTGGDSSETGSYSSPTSIFSSIAKPGHHHNDDDDILSFSSIAQFFKPAINAIGWLATISPLTFGIFSFLLAPIVFFFSGTSGIAALFAPWAFSAREAPKIVHVYRPYWHWDDEIKTWHLHSFPHTRRWNGNPSLPRSSREESTNTGSIKPTLFYKLKEWMKSATQRLKERSNNSKMLSSENRKSKRKKRETWTTRIKNLLSINEFKDTYLNGLEKWMNLKINKNVLVSGKNIRMTRIPIQQYPTTSHTLITSETPQEGTIKKEEIAKPVEATTAPAATSETSRDVKTKSPLIRDSIKMVANQLLDKPSNSSETPILSDTRIPPKLKSQLSHKHKIKTRNEDGDEPIENAHAGVAVPMTMEELETENKISESSTSNEGISTWILLSNPSNATVSTEPTKIDESQKKQKPNISKNKTKKPPNKANAAKRPVIGSTNKADLIASGSAINENVYNKIKDTVLSNVQKNKNTPTPRTTTTVSTTTTTTTEAPTTKKEVTKAPAPIIPVVKITAKPSKKKNKNKQKATTTEAPEIEESALLPMEPKEQEIELEVSTPPTTTKKPKRSSTRKKNKTKKRKTSKPKPNADTAVSEHKTTTSNKTKSAKPSKKPAAQSGPITTQIYNYLSREVMPSVGVGVIGLASLVGLASYFLYPFSTPVRRTFEVDKKDDLYRNNAEEYANEGNGQAEEEMLGTVLAGMPAHSKQKLNPYAGQTHVTQTHVGVNRYPVKKEQDLRYRHVATSYEPNYNIHYPQQKTGIAHAAVYAKPLSYGHQQYETRNVYTTEAKYAYDKGPSAYTPYPAVEPIYAAPQTGPSGSSLSGSSYGSVSDVSSSVVYGVKPSADSDFRPVYPFEGKIFSETTSNPITYPPTSMYLGSNNDPEEPQETQYEDNGNMGSEQQDVDNKFVVGNVPKELVESATPAVVPEHGPRNIRKKRHAVYRKRALAGSIEEMLKEANKDVFISNEIDETPGLLIRNLAASTDPVPVKDEVASTPDSKDVYTVYAMSVDPIKEEKATEESPSQDMLVESVSTVPIDKTTETDPANELDVTTKGFRIYEVFTNTPVENTDQKSQTLKDDANRVDTTTQFKNMMTETTTEFKSETTSTMPPSPSPISETKLPSSPTNRPKPTLHPEVITYPPLNQEGGFFSFLKRLVEFKYRLGLSILQTTSDNLNRYLRSMGDTVQKVAKASN